MKKCWRVLACIGILFAGTVLSACNSKDTVSQSDTSQSDASQGELLPNDSTQKEEQQPIILNTEDLLNKTENLSYMIYYGTLNDEIIETAKQYDMVVIHPRNGNITREQVQEIRSAGTYVFGYISIGEDLRTAGLSAEQMLKDERFIGDGTGPRVDPRPEGETSLSDVALLGEPSPAGTGYASYYLDDNNYDGKPDINVNFNCAFTNIGDPAWFEVLENMTIDGEDKIPGIREILSDDYGRGLGCDGLFLDTLDTCAPNAYTADDVAYKTRFEWTSPGVQSFMEHLKEAYPEKLIIQNRGLFFYNPLLKQFKYSPREHIDFLMYESYMLDSNTNTLYIENYHFDNKYNYMPRIMAEAGRPDGFKVLSLGYAEGPEEYELKATLLGESEVGLDILLEDMEQAQDIAGFNHYISDGAVTLVNDFVLTHTEEEDTSAPEWNSVYNASTTWPPEAPEPRIGIGQTEAIEGGVIVRWDVAIDRSGVEYTLYCQREPFDFEADPELTKATQMRLVPEMGEGYEEGIGPDTYPYQATVTGLEAGETYYFVIRAKDTSSNKNEEKNTEVLSDIPL